MSISPDAVFGDLPADKRAEAIKNAKTHFLRVAEICFDARAECLLIPGLFIDEESVSKVVNDLWKTVLSDFADGRYLSTLNETKPVD